MINIEEINKTITELENGETSFSNCQKLSCLYIVRDHLSTNSIADAVTFSEVQDDFYANAYKMPRSEFLQAADGKDMNKVLEILDEHFECVKLLYPKEYSMVMRKIREL